jgi:membrane protease YdiL (CAAX protease family)
MAGLLMLGAGLAACLVVFQMLGIRYGEGDGSAVSTSLWVTLLVVIRAGVAEEVFYRGYAIERLESLTGSRWVAILLPLVCFAGFHFRQGLPGIFLALALGAILTGLYLWKRNLAANIVAHFLIDFGPNVLLPLLMPE